MARHVLSGYMCTSAICHLPVRLPSYCSSRVCQDCVIDLQGVTVHSIYVRRLHVGIHSKTWGCQHYLSWCSCLHLSPCRLQAIAGSIQVNNPGYAIPDSKMLGFSSMSDANAFMLDHPFALSGGVHFSTAAVGGIGYTLQTNGSVSLALLDTCTRPFVLSAWAPMMHPSA